jgi:hypothetical protein
MILFYPGQLVILRKGLKYIRCVVVDIDATFVTLRLDYKKGIGATIKVRKDSTDLIKFDVKSKSNKYMNTEAFDPDPDKFLL